MYIEMRMMSAFQSVASASREAVLRHWLYHCRPCVDMPRNWIGWLNWLHSFVPHTCSWPLMATGVFPGGMSADTFIRSRLGPPLAVVALARIVAPALSTTGTLTSIQVVQDPVPGKLTVWPLTDSGRLTVVPLA